MISTVCLNPAIDQNAEVDRLRIGGMNRIGNMQAFAAGKGVNVAVVLHRLGVQTQCFGFVGDADETYFLQSMRREGVPYHTVVVPGSVRRNVKLVETDSRIVTELNQPGAEANAEALRMLESMLITGSDVRSYIALCGSLPLGCQPDAYLALMRNHPDRQWIVDTSGAAMRYALQGRPFLIKPNQTELEEIVGESLKDLDAVKAAAVSLCRAGVRYTVVSLGGQGALATDGDRTVFAPALPVKASFTVGAGDALLAGLLYGLDKGETVFESLRYGIAAGAACVEGGSIPAFSKQRFDELLAQVKVRDL